MPLIAVIATSEHAVSCRRLTFYLNVLTSLPFPNSQQHHPDNHFSRLTIYGRAARQWTDVSAQFPRKENREGIAGRYAVDPRMHFQKSAQHGGALGVRHGLPRRHQTPPEHPESTRVPFGVQTPARADAAGLYTDEKRRTQREPLQSAIFFSSFDLTTGERHGNWTELESKGPDPDTLQQSTVCWNHGAGPPAVCMYPDRGSRWGTFDLALTVEK